MAGKMTKHEKELVKKIGLLCKGADLRKCIKQLCGERIGSGLYRGVYELKIDPDYVVKVECNPAQSDFVNAMEWRNYIQYQMTPMGELMCPCLCINETGQILIMKRCEPATRRELPKKIPAAFTDLKVDNFGKIDGRVYIMDYAFLVADQTMKTAKYFT